MSIPRIPEKPWNVPGKWSVSMNNFATEIRDIWKLPKYVSIHDATLRDGEQAPGVVFRIEEKLRIAHMLNEMGVHRIEGGYASVSEEDAEALTKIAKEIKGAEVSSFSRTRQDDIDLAIKCGVKRIILEVPASEEFIKNIWGSREKAVETAIALVNHAKKRGLKVTLFLFDSSRATMELLEGIIPPIVREGKPDSVCFVDTMGCTLPTAFAWMIGKVKKMVDIPIEAHCHNRWGLATANSLAAVCAGAEVVHTCINALGGNAAIDECVMGIHGLIGIDTGIKTEDFFQVSHWVRDASKANWQKAFVDRLEGLMEVGIATKVMWEHRHEPGLGAPDGLNYDVVGSKNAVALGKKSGKYSLMLKAEEFELPLPTEEQSSKMLNEIKRLSQERKGLVTDDEFKQLYRIFKE